jgi:hypothetical protein
MYQHRSLEKSANIRHPLRFLAFRGDPAMFLLLLALLVAVLVKAMILVRTVCISRDGVDYIQYAIYLQRQPWSVVVRQSQQHPLYPLAIAGCQRLLFPGRELEPEAWQLAAQLANFLAGLLATPAIFLLTRRLVGTTAAFWVAVLFNLLPGLASCLCDALSEGLYLAGVFWSLLLVSIGLQQGRWYWFAAGGLACGLAYLTRPEAAIFALTVLISIPALYFRRYLPGSAGQLVRTMVSFFLPLVISVFPYTYAIGGLTVKPSGRLLLNAGAAGSAPISAIHTTCSLLAAHIPDAGNVGIFRALVYVLEDIAQGFFYAPLILVVPGLVLALRRLRRDPLWLLVTLFVLIYMLVLWRGALVLGYSAERYSYPITICGLMCAGLTWRFAKASVWWHQRSCGAVSWRWLQNLQRLFNFALAGFLAVCVGKLVCEPLHAGAIGHRQAGYWLRQHLRPGDNLFDPYGLAAFYSGYALEWAIRYPQQIGTLHGDWWFVFNRQERDYYVLSKIVAFHEVAYAARMVFESDTPVARQVVVFHAPGPVHELSPLGGRYWPRVR